MSNKINILFLGDITGRPGRRIVRDFLSEKKSEFDFIIANVENASHGFGLTQKNHNELAGYGIDCFTSGNHIWDKKDIFEYINDSDRLIRPFNYPEGTPGTGLRIFEKNGVKIAVMSLLGRVFMNATASPWEIAAKEIEAIKKVTPVVIIDFHAEATAEKICFGRFCSDLKVTAVIGTHTHVQTADEQILNNYTGYITDVGFCGASDGVIGMNYETSLKRLVTGLPERFEVAQGKTAELNAVIFSVDTTEGRVCSIEKFKFNKCYCEV